MILILSLLTACPPETPDNKPTDNYNTKAPTFDYKVINKSISGLEEDLTSDLYYNDTVNLGKICFKASLGKSIADDSSKLADLAQDILQYDPPVTINSEYNGYFF